MLQPVGEGNCAAQSVSRAEGRLGEVPDVLNQLEVFTYAQNISTVDVQ